MSARALQVFGVDYMVVLYLYFPNESKVQKNKIYSVLRHPTYTGAILICLGGTLFTFTPLSFAAFAVFLFGFYIHVYFVEEKELIERFGESYRGYRKKVPAFFVKLKDVRALLNFLSGKDDN
jgi:protein-S-isoprenylcysteine O-methyltransferase Ste14